MDRNLDSTAGTKANLKKYINHDGKWRFFPVAKQDGKPAPNTVLIDGVPTVSKSGTFYLEWRQDGKRVQKPVGSSPREALNAWRVKSGNLADPSSALDAEADPELDGRTTIDSAVATFLGEVKATKSDATHRAYGRDLDWFKKNIKKHYVTQVTRTDIIRLMGLGRDEELNQKTTNKRLIVTLMALRNAGAVIEMKKGDWPKTTDIGVEVYEPEEVKAFFNACNPEELVLFQTFYCTGFRANEMATLCWSDVDWKQHKLYIRPKPQFKFKPKNYEERSVTVPASLIGSLRVHQKTCKGAALMFPSKPHPKRPNYGGDAPDAHHLELCKEIAYRAGLNCGHCTTSEGKCSEGPYCRKWYLHRWRHTFATNLLQSGVDLKSLQKLLGHKQLATTEKYLAALHSDDLMQKIEGCSLAAMLG